MVRLTMTEELAKKIAAEYAKSGFGSKSEALISAGIDPKYAKSGMGYKAFGGKMVQKAIKDLASRATEDMSPEEIVADLVKLAHPGPDDSVSDANRLIALDKLAKIKNCYRDAAGDSEKLAEIAERMSEEEKACALFWAKLRTAELSCKMTPEEIATFRLSKESEARSLLEKYDAQEQDTIKLSS